MTDKYEYRYKGNIWTPDVEYLNGTLLAETDFYTYFELENGEKIKIYHENLLYIKKLKGATKV